ncbi:outer membrane protein assembly factor BamB family protein [Streptomyces justiciae]|uniref:PQQ-binding-like beta-propeller repeat protein n=1 Tax=Streptomyces justiciae TaxID=2780140 RepID=A0ABU3LSZ7_9ACTN|nr:PQQ-binding-like beta-propeller repeat protein [Streptomyces justiciae]MDT7842345.1 PQQ-binding-like beta-propeller repeat protein [Streptomyces justiciae]
MPPEQFSAPHEVGPAADIFSLGAVVAFAASGKGPFDSPSPYETAIRVVEGTPELADVHPELLPFIRLCLEKEPKSRPTADELLRLVRDGTLPTTGPPTLVDAPRPRRRRGRLWLAATAGAAVLAAIVGTTLALTDDEATDPGNLPAGWEAWHRQAKDPSVDKDPMGPTALFNRCVASGASLVCAGDEIMATRFALADGANTWGRPIDPTAEDADFGSSSSGAGTIIGARDGRVYVYGADDRPTGSQASYPTRYTIQALDAESGKPAWKTVTADSADGTEPSSDQGASAAVPAGVVTVYGRTGNQYALLDAQTGRIRWKRPLPNPNQYMSLLRSVGGQAYLLTAKYTTDDIENTNVSQLDPATGKPRWTVKLKGDVDIVGRRDGRLLLNTTGPRRTLTLIKTSTHIVTTVKLAKPQPEAATPTLAGGTLYFTLSNGGIRAVDPDTGRRLWEGNSGVELAGPPTASRTHLYLASPSGRLAAVNRTTGKVDGTLDGRDDGAVDGRDDGAVDGSPTGAPLTLVGDALYVPYGLRSVYTVDVRTL